MGLILGIVGAVGVGVSAAGQIMSANAQRDAQEQSAELKREQAAELDSRELVNESIMRTQEGRSEDLYASAFASSGRGGSGGIGGIMRMQSDFAITIANAQRDEQFKAYMLRKGADIDQTLASDAATAGYLGAAGTILGGGIKIASQYMKSPSSPQQLSVLPKESDGPTVLPEVRMNS